MKGRPPKTRQEKEAAGTLRADRDHVPVVIGSTHVGLEPYPGMTAEAVTVWGIVIDDLVSAGVVQSVDRIMLMAFCEAVAVMQRLTPGLCKPVIKQPSGRIAPSPAFKVWQEAVNTALKLSDHFGLTPIGRVRLGMSGAIGMRDAADEMNDLIGKAPHLRAVEGGSS